MEEPPHPATILVVDDDQGLLRLIEKSLRRAGFVAATTHSGSAAIDWLSQNRADLALVDLKLQDITGPDLLSQLAETHRSVPFIIITGQGDERVAVDMMKRGAVDYLVKDKEFLELVPAVVRRALAQLEKERRLAAMEEALRVSEERFRIVLKNSPIMVFRQDRELRYTWIHNSVHFPEAAFLGKTDAELFPPEESARLNELKRRVLKSGLGLREEVYWTLGGETLTFDLTVEPVRDASGAVSGITCAAMDITKRKRAEVRQLVEYGTTRTLAEAESLSGATPRILQVVCETLGWSFGELWTVDREAGVLHCVEVWHQPRVEYRAFEALTRLTRFSVGVGLPGRVWENGKPLWIAEVAEDENLPRSQVALSEGLCSAFAFPILLGHEVLGVMTFFSREIRRPDSDLLQMFAAIGSQVGQFIERKRAEDALRQKEQHYRSLIETAGSVVICLSPDHRIFEWNREAERVFGWKKSEVLNQDYFELFLPGSVRPKVAEDFSRVLAGETTRGFENPIRTRAGVERILQWNIARLSGIKGEALGIIAIGQDVTEGKESEEALRQSEASLRKAQAIAHLGNYNLRITGLAADEWSDESQRILGLDPAQGALSLEEHLRRIVHPEDQMLARRVVEQSLANAVAFDVEYRVARPDGSIRYVQSTGEPVFGADGKPVRLVGTLLDVTERKQLQNEILRISELEQHRIGQDLHDGLCQHLAGIELMSRVLEQTLAKKSKSTAGQAAKIAEYVREAISQTRMLARGLSPVVLESEGLMCALQELASNTEKLFHISCVFRSESSVLIEDIVMATHLYRIAQEAVSNAIKHGKSSHIEIGLFRDGGVLTLVVKDNGVGIAEVLPHDKGMGLRIMRYRAAMINASLALQREPGGGTTIQCFLETPAGPTAPPALP